MDEGKRYIFFDLETGDVLVNEARNRCNIMPTVERVIETYRILSDRFRDTFGVIEMKYTQYLQDFAECNGVRVNTDLLASLPAEEEYQALEFSYPDPNEAEPQEPIYRKPLSEEINDLKQCIAELTILMAGGLYNV